MDSVNFRLPAVKLPPSASAGPKPEQASEVGSSKPDAVSLGEHSAPALTKIDLRALQSSEPKGLVDILTASSKPIPKAHFNIFGATGDLVSRHAVREALVHLAENGRLTHENQPVTLMSSRPMPVQDYLVKFKAGDAESKPISEKGFEAFKTLTGLDHAEGNLLAVNLAKPETLAPLQQAADHQSAVFWGAVAPKFYDEMLTNSQAAGLAQAEPGTFRRFVLEKPFGSTSSEAQQLAQLEKQFQPGQILLVDHFMGYPGMLNMISLRSNGLVDEALNSKYVESVDVMMLEKVKSNDRPYFRDTGILKDMVQNHGMQIFSNFAMEVPQEVDGDKLRAARENVVGAVKVDPQSVRFGQFEGFNDPALGSPVDAAPSQAETLVKFDFKVDVPRWQGVQFHMINAKGTNQKRSGVDVHLRQLPEKLAEQLGASPYQKAILHITVNGDSKVQIELPQEKRTVDVAFDQRIADQPAYSTLISNAIQGETALFVSPQEAISGWKVADEVEKARNLHPGSSYTVGTDVTKLDL